MRITLLAVVTFSFVSCSSNLKVVTINIEDVNHRFRPKVVASLETLISTAQSEKAFVVADFEGDRIYVTCPKRLEKMVVKYANSIVVPSTDKVTTK